MPYEIEVKASVDNLDIIKEKLSGRGCIWLKQIHQCDRIYSVYWTQINNEMRERVFLRVRSENGIDNILTFKCVLDSMEVVEHESTIGQPQEVIEIIKWLGFKEYAIVNKRRLVGKLNGYNICLDDVDELGCFIELERIADEESLRVSIKNSLQGMLASLGIDEKQICNERYHVMIHNLRKREVK